MTITPTPAPVVNYSPSGGAVIPAAPTGITPQPGYVQDPNNANGVVPIASPAPSSPTPVSSTPPTISVGGLQTPQTPVTSQQSPVASPVSVPSPTTPVADTTTQPGDFVTQLGTLEAEALGKSSDTLNTENQATAPIQAQLDSITSQINAVDAANLREKAAIAQNGGDTGFQGRLAGNSDANAAAQKLALTAQATALKGDLVTAKAQADAAVEAKYAQVTLDTQTARSNIIANWDSLTPEQQAVAKDTLLQLDKTDSFVTQQIADQKTIQGIAVTAAGNKASTAVIAQISAAKSPEEAAKIAADNNVDGSQSTSIHDIGGRTVLLNTKTGAIVKDLGPSSASKPTDAQTATQNTVNNIIDGVSTLSDLVSSTGTKDANYQNVVAQLNQLGFNSDTPPTWFVTAQNDQFGGDVLPSVIQAKWSALKTKALGTSS